MQNFLDIVKRGAKRVRSRSPASVGATLRVVRASSGTPSSASRLEMAWLTADGAIASSLAAPRKLPCAATTDRTAS